jgi:hypothetical protein
LTVVVEDNINDQLEAFVVAGTLDLGRLLQGNSFHFYFLLCWAGSSVRVSAARLVAFFAMVDPRVT